MKGNIEISYLQKKKYVLLKNRRHFIKYLYSIKIPLDSGWSILLQTQKRFLD